MNKINSLRERYYNLATGKESLLTLIAEAEVFEQVYNSNAIENSTLSFEETEKILTQINPDRFISAREIFEAKNLAQVMTYITKRAHEAPINLDEILLLHKMLLTHIHDDIAGRLRQEQENVRVGSHIAPPPKEVFERVQGLLAQYHARVHEPIVKRIAKFHLVFEYTHPFVDGNGRIGRVLNNYLLIREGYVPIDIKFVDREKYYNAFKEFDEKRTTKLMEDIINKALINSYFKRLAYLEEKKIVTLAEFAKINKISHSNLINKAHRQTIEAFSEKGIWKIGMAQDN